MAPKAGSTVWLEVERISRNGNGVVELDDGGHLNVGPVKDETVGQTIEVKMTGNLEGHPVDADLRRDVYAQPAEHDTSLSVGDVVSGTVQRTTSEGVAFLREDGVRIRVPGADLGESVELRIGSIDYSNAGWHEATGERLDQAQVSPTADAILDVNLFEGTPDVDGTVTCPVSSCEYNGEPASVAGHINGKPDASHDWERLGYSGAVDYKSQMSTRWASRDSETSLLHVTDTHLGKEEGGYGKNTWPVDCEAGFERSIDLAIDRDVDGVLHTGDLFHAAGGVVADGVVAACREQLERLAAEEIPFYFVYGNHERDAGREPLEALVAEGLAVHLDERPTLLGEGFALYGADFEQRQWWTEHGFEPAPAPAGRRSVAAVHQSISPISNADRTECEVGDVVEEPGTGVSPDVVALGHLHRDTVAWHGDTAFVCGGATERLGKRGFEPFVGLLEESEDGLRYRRFSV